MLLRFLQSSDRLITISYMWFTPGGVSEQFFKMACLDMACLDTHNVEVKYSHNGSRQNHLFFCITLKISLKVYILDLSRVDRLFCALNNVVRGVVFIQISLSLPMNDHSAIACYSTVEI